MDGGDAEGVDGRGGPLAAADRRGVAGSLMCEHTEVGWSRKGRGKGLRFLYSASSVPTLAEYAECWLTEAIAPHRKPRTEDYYRTVPARAPLPARVRKAPSHRDQTRPGSCLHRAEAQREGLMGHRQEHGGDAAGDPVPGSANGRAVSPAIPAARFGRLFDARHDGRQRVVVLEPEDVARVLRAATKWYAEHELAIRMHFHTGMREGEMLASGGRTSIGHGTWSTCDVPLHSGQHRLIVNTPKSGKLRTNYRPPRRPGGQFRELHSIRQAQAVVESAAMSPWIFRSATESDEPMNDACSRRREGNWPQASRNQTPPAKRTPRRKFATVLVPPG